MATTAAMPNEVIEKMAKDVLKLETRATRGSDSLDFSDKPSGPTGGSKSGLRRAGAARKKKLPLLRAATENRATKNPRHHLAQVNPSRILFESTLFGDNTDNWIESLSFFPGSPKLPFSVTDCRPAEANVRVRCGQERPSELIQVYSTFVAPLVTISPCNVKLAGHEYFHRPVVFIGYNFVPVTWAAATGLSG